MWKDESERIVYINEPLEAGKLYGNALKKEMGMRRNSHLFIKGIFMSIREYRKLLDRTEILR